MKAIDIHREFWLKVARAYETAPSRRTVEQKDLAGDGLCMAQARAWDDTEAAIEFIECDYDIMHHTFMESVQSGSIPIGTGYWWPTKCASDYPVELWTRQCDFERAVFAGFMAALSEEDLREMAKAKVGA